MDCYYVGRRIFYIICVIISIRVFVFRSWFIRIVELGKVIGGVMGRILGGVSWGFRRRVVGSVLGGLGCFADCVFVSFFVWWTTDMNVFLFFVDLFFFVLGGDDLCKELEDVR